MDDSVSISGEDLGKLDHWSYGFHFVQFYFTLESQRAPEAKKLQGTLGVSVLPESFKLIFQNIDGAQGFLKFQDSLQFGFFFFSARGGPAFGRKESLWVLKQEIMVKLWQRSKIY
jgi:hypothetical protein